MPVNYLDPTIAHSWKNYRHLQFSPTIDNTDNDNSLIVIQNTRREASWPQEHEHYVYAFTLRTRFTATNISQNKSFIGPSFSLDQL